MLTIFTTATAVLILIVIYQERKYKYFQELTLTIVCRKWWPATPIFDKENRKNTKTQNKKILKIK